MARIRWGLALVSALAVTLAACGSDPEDLDMKKARTSIDQLATKVYSGESKVGAVKCPDSVPVEKSLVFICTVAIDGTPLRIRLKQTDAKGNVHIEQADSVIYTAKLVDFVTTYADGHDRPGTTADCGKTPVITGPPGKVLTCDVTFSDGTEGVAKVVINDTDGKVGLVSLKPKR